jgi:hypothetical protein
MKCSPTSANSVIDGWLVNYRSYGSGTFISLGFGLRVDFIRQYFVYMVRFRCSLATFCCIRDSQHPRSESLRHTSTCMRIWMTKKTPTCLWLLTEERLLLGCHDLGGTERCSRSLLALRVQRVHGQSCLWRPLKGAPYEGDGRHLAGPRGLHDYESGVIMTEETAFAVPRLGQASTSIFLCLNNHGPDIKRATSLSVVLF